MKELERRRNGEDGANGGAEAEAEPEVPPGPSSPNFLRRQSSVVVSDEVFKAREHLKANNVPIQFEGRRRAGIQVAVEFLDPDGHWLEIFWGLDQIGPHDLARPPSEWVEAFSLENAIDDAPTGQDTTLKDPSLRNY